MRDTLAALIERLEKATGPDRELDAQVYCVIHGNTYSRRYGNDFAMYVAGVPHEVKIIDRYLDRYTASLDAAVSLVPEGWGWHVDYLPPQTPWASLVWQGRMRHDCHAATPALALAAAALRARMESER